MLSTSSSIQDKSFQETCNFIITLLHVVLKEKQLFYMYLWQESVTRMSRTRSWWADRNCVLFSMRTISMSPKAATDTASFMSIWMKLSPFLRHHSLHKVTKLWYICKLNACTLKHTSHWRYHCYKCTSLLNEETFDIFKNCILLISMGIH